jgi:hypothetical protein
VARKPKKVLTVVELARLGALARNRKLTAEERSASAVHANRIRWARYRAKQAGESEPRQSAASA